jgi:hypothetical protein
MTSGSQNHPSAIVATSCARRGAVRPRPHARRARVGVAARVAARGEARSIVEHVAL